MSGRVSVLKATGCQPQPGSRESEFPSSILLEGSSESGAGDFSLSGERFEPQRSGLVRLAGQFRTDRRGPWITRTDWLTWGTSFWMVFRIALRAKALLVGELVFGSRSLQMRMPMAAHAVMGIFHVC